MVMFQNNESDEVVEHLSEEMTFCDQLDEAAEVRIITSNSRYYECKQVVSCNGSSSGGEEPCFSSQSEDSSESEDSDEADEGGELCIQYRH